MDQFSRILKAIEQLDDDRSAEVCRDAGFDGWSKAVLLTHVQQWHDAGHNHKLDRLCRALGLLTDAGLAAETAHRLAVAAEAANSTSIKAHNLAIVALWVAIGAVVVTAVGVIVSVYR